MKKQKPGRKRGNPAKQRAKCTPVAARARHIDPPTALSRTAMSWPSPAASRTTIATTLTSLSRASIARAPALPNARAIAKPKATATALSMRYAREDRQALAMLCAPFLILAMTLAFQHMMRSIPAAAPEIAMPREAAPPPAPVAAVPTVPAPAPLAEVAMAPQTPVPPVAVSPIAPVPDAAPIEPPPVAATAAPPPAPVVEAPVPLPPLVALVPPPSAPEPADVLPSIAPAPAPPAIAIEEPLPSTPAPERHAALAPIAPPEIATAAPVPMAPEITQPVLPPAAPEQAIDVRPPLVSPATPPLAKPEKCEAPPQLFAASTVRAIATPDPARFGLSLAAAAREQLSSVVIYNAKYARIGFPNGDVAPLFGVCTDVVVRAYRALGIDLQQLIADTRTGRGDRNIDHRRVEVMRRFLTLHGETLPITGFAEDYQPGDIVTYYRPQNRTSTSHIAIVSDMPAPSGRYMIVHNRGWGPQLEDALFVDKITGHFRFAGLGRKVPETAPLATAPIASAAPWTMPAMLKRTVGASTSQLPAQQTVAKHIGEPRAAMCTASGKVITAGAAAANVPEAQALGLAPDLSPATPTAPSARSTSTKPSSPKALQKAATGARAKAEPARPALAPRDS